MNALAQENARLKEALHERDLIIDTMKAYIKAMQTGSFVERLLYKAIRLITRDFRVKINPE